MSDRASNCCCVIPTDGWDFAVFFRNHLGYDGLFGNPINLESVYRLCGINAVSPDSSFLTKGISVLTEQVSDLTANPSAIVATSQGYLWLRLFFIYPPDNSLPLANRRIETQIVRVSAAGSIARSRKVFSVGSNAGPAGIPSAINLTEADIIEAVKHNGIVFPSRGASGGNVTHSGVGFYPSASGRNALEINGVAYNFTTIRNDVISTYPSLTTTIFWNSQPYSFGKQYANAVTTLSQLPVVRQIHRWDGGEEPIDDVLIFRRQFPCLLNIDELEAIQAVLPYPHRATYTLDVDHVIDKEFNTKTRRQNVDIQQVGRYVRDDVLITNTEAVLLESWDRDNDNYLLIGTSAHPTQFVVGVRQETLDNDVTLTDDINITPGIPGFPSFSYRQRTYTHTLTIRWSLVLGTFDPTNIGVKDVIQVFWTSSPITTETDHVVTEAYYNTINPAVPPVKFDPEIDTEAWKSVSFVDLFGSSLVGQNALLQRWDINRDGSKWCARVYAGPEEFVFSGANEGRPVKTYINGTMIRETTLSDIINPVGEARKSSLLAWGATAFADLNDTEPPDSLGRPNWPPPFADWPEYEDTWSVEDEVTLVSNTKNYRWYTENYTPVMVVDDPDADIDAVVMAREFSLARLRQSYSPFNYYVGLMYRTRIEFWGGGELRDVTWTATTTNNDSDPSTPKWFCSHGPYVYASYHHWELGSTSQINLPELWILDPDNMERARGLKLAGYKNQQTFPWGRLHRWPLPHQSWTLLNKSQTTWLPLNPTI